MKLHSFLSLIASARHTLSVAAVASLSVCAAMAQQSRSFELPLSADGEARLYAYLPSSPTGRAVVDCPGGGYSHLALQHEGHDWAPWFNAKGIAYFVVKYRMPKGDRSIPIADAEKAMLTVRDSAQAWHINPSDVGIMGFSAGGHLASTVSTHAAFGARPDFSILFYPVITMGQGTHEGSRINLLGASPSRKLMEEFSNERQVRIHLTPPAIIIMANDDQVVPPVENGVAYYSAMRRVGNDCSALIYPTGGHGFGFRASWPYHVDMLQQLSSWLDKLPAPKADAIRVACVGNSITEGFGVGMATANGYPAELQRLLGDRYQVKNFGVSSRTLLSKGDLPYTNELAFRDALAFNAQEVYIMLGTNDSKTRNWAHGDDYEADLSALVNAFRKDNRQPVIYLMKPIPAFKSTWTITDSIIAGPIAKAIDRVAKRKKCHVIDLHTLFKPYSQLMLDDGIHPNARGAKRMAELVFEASHGSQADQSGSLTTARKKR